MAHPNYYFGDGKKKVQTQIQEREIKETIERAKKQNEEIKAMYDKIEDITLKINIREIGETAEKIIGTVEHHPNKLKKVGSFFDYYLPAVVGILKRYDEIENQRLVSNDSKEFMKQAGQLIVEVNKAFKKQLAGMYQKDIVDTDAEMKVLNMMLKSEGLDSNSIDHKDN